MPDRPSARRQRPSKGASQFLPPRGRRAQEGPAGEDQFRHLDIGRKNRTGAELEVWRLNQMSPIGLDPAERDELARRLRGPTLG